MEDVIEFFQEDTQFELADPQASLSWLMSVAARYEQEVGEMAYIFCSDEYLLALNEAHLNHDFYTDILTFPLSEPGQPLEADIYISVDRVQENAATFHTSFDDELHRVMVHGLLHMIGFDDHEPENEFQMRKAEEEALSLRKK